MGTFHFAVTSGPVHQFESVSEAELHIVDAAKAVDFTYGQTAVDKLPGHLDLARRLTPDHFIGSVTGIELATIDDAYSAYCSVVDRGGTFADVSDEALSNPAHLNKRFMLGFKIDFGLKVTGRKPVPGLSREVYLHPYELTRTNRKFFPLDGSRSLMRVSVVRASGVVPERHFAQARKAQSAADSNNGTRKVHQPRGSLSSTLAKG